jgi:FGFR1 oncogene partner
MICSCVVPNSETIATCVLSDRRGGSSASNTRKDEYNWRYDTTDDISEEVLRASTALESVQLDRKSRNLPTSWR